MRRLLLLLLALPLLALGADFVLWRWAEQQLATGLAEWDATQHENGWTLSAGTPSPGGFPLGATLTLPRTTLSGGADILPGGIDWTAERVVLRLALLHPRALVIAFEGRQSLRAGKLPAQVFAADQMHAAVPLDPTLPAGIVDLTAINLRNAATGQGTPGNGLSIANLQLHAETRAGTNEGEPAVSVSMQANGIGLPQAVPGSIPGGVSWPLGPSIAHMDLDGAIDGPMPHAEALPARLTAWRDGGGTVAIQKFSLEWGPLALGASATLALDQDLQPMGAASARVAGWADTLDALARAHMLSPRAALAAKAVLGLLARTPEEGGGSEVEIPLAVQDRALSMGRIPLARLPMINWLGN